MIEIIKNALTFKYGGMSENELKVLYDICLNKDILELGSMAGMSSYVIASVAKILSCVDAWDDEYHHLSHDYKQQKVYFSLIYENPSMYSSFLKNCIDFIRSGKIKMYRGYTDQMCPLFNDESVDILLIDADHSYFGVSNDYINYKNKVKKDGLVIFHDYGDSMWVDIKKFADEMVNKNELIMIQNVERIAVFKRNY